MNVHNNSKLTEKSAQFNVKESIKESIQRFTPVNPNKNYQKS